MSRFRIPTNGSTFQRTTFPEEWEVKPLSELVDSDRGISYGIVQPGNHDPDGIPIIRVNNVREGRIDTEDIRRVSPSIAKRYQRTKLRGNEVLLSVVGTVGETLVVSKELVGWNVARAIAVLPVRDDIGSNWVNVCLKSAQLQNLMRDWCNTTVQPTLNLGEVARLPIPLPPPKTRAAITEILGRLDDKIGVNRRINRTLEQMAQALYKHWFVDFGPFQDSEFVESELGPIPAGWEVGIVEDLFVLQRGFDLPTRERIAGPHPIFAASGLNGSHIEYKVKGPGVVTGRSGKLGEVFYVPNDFWPLNTTLWVREFKAATPLYAYHFLQRFSLETFNTGSAVPTLNRNDIHGLTVVVPPAQYVQGFEQQVDRWFQLCQQNSREIERLAAIRDYLLPRLLSGKVPVQAAEEMAEEVDT